MKTFGPRLRTLREKRELSQQELAQMTGIHLGQISRYERGAILPSVETVALLARSLRVTADALLFGDRKGEEPLKIENIRLFERFRCLEGMGRDEQETAIKLIDALIAKHELEHLADRVKRPA